MLHVVLDRQKTILEKAFFLILWRFKLFGVFVSQNLKKALLRGEIFFSWNRSYRVSKIENFILISNKQTCLSDKMPPKKLKFKKMFSNFAKSHFLFFNLNFFGGYFITKVSLYFWNQHKILDCLIPNMTYFKEKSFYLSEGPFFKFFHARTKKDRNATK